ncbi:hypothetical protein JTE90_008014 [Oedothorax gibbosus]|uniref:Uncharacterized protein n=1 Tax=Oedothorax gibbosus TaxID=931172 RepID=A0AAV6UX99_9ARAC|nr:hypothetical protein JTE90_008014 [Oedothorax gibbosus]
MLVLQRETEQAVEKNRLFSSYKEERVLKILLIELNSPHSMARKGRYWCDGEEMILPPTLQSQEDAAIAFPQSQDRSVGSLFWSRLGRWTCVDLVFLSRIAEEEIRRGPMVVRHDWPVSRLPDSSARVRLAGKRR